RNSERRDQRLQSGGLSDTVNETSSRPAAVVLAGDARHRSIYRSDRTRDRTRTDRRPHHHRDPARRTHPRTELIVRAFPSNWLVTAGIHRLDLSKPQERLRTRHPDKMAYAKR